MNRSIEKALADYQRITNGNENGKGAFFPSDIEQIFNSTIGQTLKEKSVLGNSDFYDAIHSALKTGYAIGYRTAQRDSRAE